MKPIYLILLLVFSCVSSAQAEGVSYSMLAKVLPLLETKEEDGLGFAPLYLKPNVDGIDLIEGEYFLEKGNQQRVVLGFDILESVAGEALNEIDKEHIQGGYVIKLWIPVDESKFQGWSLIHSFKEGALEVSFKAVLAEFKVNISG